MKTTCPVCRAPVEARSRWTHDTSFNEIYECGAAYRWGTDPRVLTPRPVVTRPNETTPKEVR